MDVEVLLIQLFALRIPLSKKVFFVYGSAFTPLFEYQQQLLQNCNSIQEADYLAVNIHHHFYKKGFLAFHWNKTYTDLFFSKPIIMMYDENLLLSDIFNFHFKKYMKAVVANNDLHVIRNYFKFDRCFIHLMFLTYVNDHNSTFQQFINRKFYIQTAIRNIRIYGNSKRKKYLRACINHFGSNKIANYGKLFHNQKLKGNQWLGKLPPSSYFGFAMENSIANYYISEKLFFSYRNDVIPIYRGSAQNTKILEEYGVNRKAYVDASNMTQSELVAYLDDLIKADNGRKMYEMYKQPLIPNKQKFDSKLVASFQTVIDSIFT